MYLSNILLPSLLPLTLIITAAPVTTPPPGGDQCGPTIQIPTDPKDTCKDQPTLSTTGPTVWGITPVSNGNLATYDPTICDPVIEDLCKTMSFTDLTLDKWHLSTYQEWLGAGGNPACLMGF